VRRCCLQPAAGCLLVLMLERALKSEARSCSTAAQRHHGKQLLFVWGMPRLVPLFLVELVVLVVQVDQAVVEF